MINEIFTQQLTGAQIFMKCLREEGVDTVFGYPGAIILSIYEEFYKANDITHYLVRHEQAAVHAAEGYARVADKPGVVLVTSGPGATNVVTGVANAYLDGYPLVVFTGQVSLDLIGKDAFQEVNIVSMTRSCTKWSYQVKDIKDLAKTIKQAFHIANTGKKGPVVIDIPKNILELTTQYSAGETLSLHTSPFATQAEVVNKESISRSINLLSEAKNPIILAGGGIIASNASKELTELALKLNVPVTTTLMGAGAYNCDDGTNLGMLGVLGNYWANRAVSECDVLFAIGTRFNDRIINAVKACSRNNTKIIYIDINPSDFSNTFDVEVKIKADAKEVLQIMLKDIDSKKTESKTDWIKKISGWKATRSIPEVKSDMLHAHTVLNKVFEYTKKYNPIVATEVGQHQMWTAQLFNFMQPRKFLTSGGLGTMGFGFPAAMGACLADRNSLVLNIAGDGSIQMNIQELATCLEYNLPVKVIIMNNGYLGMVRQWQEKLFDKHYCGTQISGPDFAKVAKAYGALGLRIEKEEEIEPALKQAIEYPGPVFLDFIIEPFEVVYPWVPQEQ